MGIYEFVVCRLKAKSELLDGLASVQGVQEEVGKGQGDMLPYLTDARSDV